MNDFENEVKRLSYEFIKSLPQYLISEMDYSVKSIKSLDDFLDIGSSLYKSDGISEQNIESVVDGAGSYILEIGRRNFGGEYLWYEERNQPILVTGRPDFQIGLLAYEKVRSRIINGSEDDLCFFFQGYIDAINRGKDNHGYSATIV